jgi:hypothetical protein
MKNPRTWILSVLAFMLSILGAAGVAPTAAEASLSAAQVGKLGYRAGFASTYYYLVSARCARTVEEGDLHIEEGNKAAYLRDPSYRDQPAYQEGFRRGEAAAVEHSTPQKKRQFCSCSNPEHRFNLSLQCEKK